MPVILAILLASLFFGFLKILRVSTKVIMSLVWNGIVGLVMLFIFNIFSGLFGVSLEINFLNAVVAGIFGIPGIIVLLLLQ